MKPISSAATSWCAFADDFVILCKSRPQAEAALELSEAVLRELQLSLHPQKTRITNFDQGFRYLGVQFLRSMAFRPKYPEEPPDLLLPVHTAPARPGLPSERLCRSTGDHACPSASLPPETAIAQSVTDALGALPAEEAKRMWEDLCDVAEEADLPPPTVGHDPYLRSLYLMEQGAVLAKEDERFVIRKNSAILTQNSGIESRSDSGIWQYSDHHTSHAVLSDGRYPHFPPVQPRTILWGD